VRGHCLIKGYSHERSRSPGRRSRRHLAHYPTIGLLQALTQIQEATLVYAPKIIAIFVGLLLFLPLMGALMGGFMQQIAARIAAM
jgi:hypothetical protein